jgi:two-component system, OmpR family, alkaline phosphatase synthesis response regulator PhoP
MATKKGDLDPLSRKKDAMANETILVVEDDDSILELISFHLSKEGFTVQQTLTGEEALERASAMRPDLILLDLMLPKMSGLEVCVKLKEDVVTHGIPVIIVSARGVDRDVIAGLEAGADDYITKPFRPATLIADVRAMLCRVARGRVDAGQDLVFAELQMSPDKREVQVAGRPVTVTDVEFQVLHYLGLHCGQIRTRAQIRAALGVDEEDALGFSVDDLVVSLSKKLGDSGRYVEAVRRIGFRFKDSPS